MMLVRSVPWLLLVTVLVLGRATPAAAQIDEAMVARVKATFLCRVPEFTTWPDEGAAQPPDNLPIGILGQDPLGISQIIETSIARDNLKIKDRRVGLVRMTYAPRESEERAAFERKVLRCRVLFLARSEEPHWADLRKLTAGKPILVFSEIPGFSGSGRMIEFVIAQRPDGTRGIDLHVDLVAVTEAGLRLKSTFLSIRYVVVVKMPERQGALPTPEPILVAAGIHPATARSR
jgi:hypothetical protein